MLLNAKINTIIGKNLKKTKKDQQNLRVIHKSPDGQTSATCILCSAIQPVPKIPSFRHQQSSISFSI